MTLKWKAEEFSAVEWDALNDAAGGHPGLHSINVQLLLKHFGTGRERVMVCHRGRNVVAMTILTGRALATVWHPMQQTVALWVQQDDVDFAELVQLLARRGLMLSVTHMDPDMLMRPADAETLDYIETARTRFDGSFNDYWQTRPPKHRENIRRFGNRLKKDGITPRFDAVTDPAKIGAAVDAFGLLESDGWKGKNGSAVHPDNAQGAYYRDLLTAYARHGNASVWECRYDDRLVASNMLIHSEGTVLSLKITYDEAHGKTSPSLLLRYEMFRQLWPHQELIEYYGQEAGWKWWEDERRRMYHLNAFRGLSVQLARQAARALKARFARLAPPSQAAPQSGAAVSDRT